jgi:alpha-galactosidase
MPTTSLPSLLLIGMSIALQTLVAQTNPIHSPDKSLPEPTPAPTPEWPAPLTPPAPATPRIHGPSVFGVRPGSPVLYSIPATGDRPMTFAAEGLPEGLSLDSSTGQIGGSLRTVGTNVVTLIARNSKGEARKPFKIIVGEQIALTPAMGWNSWNCWHSGVDQEKILRTANALKAVGLDQHGWSYVNIDDAWQGDRNGEGNAIQANKKFPDIKGMVARIHAMGLKAGIYHTPWVMSYAGYCGGTSEDPKGFWDPKNQWPGKYPMNRKILPHAIGRFSFVKEDARQFADWGFDYLKYDWNPIEAPDVVLIHKALRDTGRDIILSLSNNGDDTLSRSIKEVAPNAESWRTTTDITDSWKSMSGIGFHQQKWYPYQSPGHFNDPDMFEIGANGGGKMKRLTPDEQYTHVSLWCLLSAPLLLGCDLDHLDPFTLGLITNDEVLALDQDELCKPALCVSPEGALKVYVKELADGTKAVGLFNTGETPAQVTLDWKQAGLSGKQALRDLWRQQDLGVFEGTYSADVPVHGVQLLKTSVPPRS